VGVRPLLRHVAARVTLTHGVAFLGRCLYFTTLSACQRRPERLWLGAGCRCGLSRVLAHPSPPRAVAARLSVRRPGMVSRRRSGGPARFGAIASTCARRTWTGGRTRCHGTPVFACPSAGSVAVPFDPGGTVALLASSGPLVYGAIATRAVNRACRSLGRLHLQCRQHGTRERRGRRCWWRSDSLGAPAGVLARQPQHEFARGRVDRRVLPMRCRPGDRLGWPIQASRFERCLGIERRSRQPRPKRRREDRGDRDKAAAIEPLHARALKSCVAFASTC
jgi:hypothetical protein